MKKILKLTFQVFCVEHIFCMDIRENKRFTSRFSTSHLVEKIGFYFQKNSIFPRGSIGYNNKRLVHNGLCAHVYPDWIVVPHRTEDVAFVVQLTNKYNIPISVRSGGHSYTCTNIRQGPNSPDSLMES